jgi:hypothetical protein
VQGLDRPAAESELTVVVVFNDRSVVAIGPRQERCSPRKRHRDPERILVRRRDVDEPCAARQRLDDETLAIDGNTDDAKPERREQVARWLIARVFHCNDITGREQHARHDVECLLRPVGDHEIVAAHVHAARNADVSSDHLAQLDVPGRMSVATAIVGVCAQRSRHQLSPRRVRKERRIGKARTKIESRRKCECGRHSDAVPHRLGAQHASACGHRVLHARDGKVITDVGA